MKIIVTYFTNAQKKIKLRAQQTAWKGLALTNHSVFVIGKSWFKFVRQKLKSITALEVTIARKKMSKFIVHLGAAVSQTPHIHSLARLVTSV